MKHNYFLTVICNGFEATYYAPMVRSENAPLGHSGVHGTNDLRGRLIMRMCWIFPSHQISTAVGAVHQVNTVSAQCQCMHTRSQAHMRQKKNTHTLTHTNTHKDEHTTKVNKFSYLFPFYTHLIPSPLIPGSLVVTVL